MNMEESFESSPRGESRRFIDSYQPREIDQQVLVSLLDNVPKDVAIDREGILNKEYDLLTAEHLVGFFGTMADINAVEIFQTIVVGGFKRLVSGSNTPIDLNDLPLMDTVAMLKNVSVQDSIKKLEPLIYDYRKEVLIDDMEAIFRRNVGTEILDTTASNTHGFMLTVETFDCIKAGISNRELDKASVIDILAETFVQYRLFQHHERWQNILSHHLRGYVRAKVISKAHDANRTVNPKSINRLANTLNEQYDLPIELRPDIQVIERVLVKGFIDGFDTLGESLAMTEPQSLDQKISSSRLAHNIADYYRRHSDPSLTYSFDNEYRHILEQTNSILEDLGITTPQDKSPILVYVDSLLSI